MSLSVQGERERERDGSMPLSVQGEREREREGWGELDSE